MTSRPTALCRRPTSGFTLIELLVVMAVLGVLAAAILPLGEALMTSQKERELRHALSQIRSALDDYKRAADQGRIAKVAESGYPPNLQALAEGVPDTSPSGTGKVIYFMRSLPRDPFSPEAAKAADSWRLRSYASPPEAPAPGQDVFDVHSTSDATALDGTRYSQW